MKHYFKALDGLRGFGIAFVLCYHYFATLNHNVLGFSWVFLQMFFVQSGFLIAGILLADKERQFGDYLKRFYWRRVLRIFPLYFLYLLAFLAVYLLFHRPADFAERAPLLFTYTYNISRLIGIPGASDLYFGHLWSLSVEEQFYVLWPLLVYFFGRPYLKVFLCLVIVIAPVVRLLLARHLLSLGIPDRQVGTDVYMFTFSQFDAFAFGAMIPVFQLGERIKRTGAWASALVGGCLGIGLLNFLLLRRAGIDVPASTLGLPNAMIANFQHVWSYTLVDLMFMSLILHLIRPGYQGVFNHPLLVNPGKIVYGIYVLHVPIMHFVREWGAPYPQYRWLFFALSCGLSWLAAALSYRFIEKRFLDLKDWVGNRNKPVSDGLSSAT